MAEKTDNLSWYDGPTVLEALDTFDKTAPPIEQPLRLPIQDVYQFDGRRASVGRVESGVIREGEEIKVMPKGKSTKVEELVEFNEDPDKAVAGKSTGVSISDKLFVDRGDVIVEPDGDPIVTDEVEAHVFWMSEEPFEEGERITFKCATQEVKADMEIDEVLDSSTLEVVSGEESEKIENRQVANVRIKTSEPVVVENFNDYQALGRFVLERTDTCAGGIITK